MSKSGPNLSDLARQHVRQRVDANEITAGTGREVGITLRLFCEQVGVTDPRQLTPVRIEDWMAGQRCAKTTLRLRYSRVRQFCRWLVRRGHMVSDPTLGIRSPRVPPAVPRALDAAAIGILIRSVPDARARLIVVWMVQLGLRCVELSRCELADINFDQRWLRVDGKGGWQRLLPIPDEAWAALVSWLGVRSARSGPLLPNAQYPWKPVSPPWISRSVAAWMREAEVAGTAHALRHTAATHLLRNGGVDVRDVQTFLGHQSLRSTSVYLPFSDVERLRPLINGRWYGPDAA